jgi:group I intron endonuclease
MIVYLLRNRQNGKCYVGKTTRTLKARWRQHRTEARIGRLISPLYEDMRAFGIDAFEVITLGEADCQRRLNQMERRFIREFNTVAEGYNQATAAFGGRVRKVRAITSATLSPTHRAKIAESVRLYYSERKAAVA